MRAPPASESALPPTAPMRPTLARWDPLNPANIIAAVLLGFAFTVYHRPYLPLFLPSYAAFDDIMPWSAWGWVAAAFAAIMLASPPSTGWRALAHALAGLFCLGVAGVFTTATGLTGAGVNYLILATVCGLMFARTAVHWQSGFRWWRTLAARPPRWLRWLARVEEYDRGSRRGR